MRYARVYPIAMSLAAAFLLAATAAHPAPARAPSDADRGAQLEVVFHQDDVHGKLLRWVLPPMMRARQPPFGDYLADRLQSA